MIEPTSDPIRYEEVIIGRFTPVDPSHDQIHADSLASGLAAVWVGENTLDAVFDALMCREVFATTGTRMRVRVFGGWKFEEAGMGCLDFAANGYDNGVPMGGILSAPP